MEKRPREGLFEGHDEGMDEDHIQLEQRWRSTESDKWDVIDSGNWIQKTVWNRMVTVSDRDQLHKTPVTSRWTSDFLTREGEVLKTMGDWLWDKTVPWKGHRRLLQTNEGTFPFEDRLQKWDESPDGIYDLCKRNREIGLKLLGGRPSHDTCGYLQNSVYRLHTVGYVGNWNT